MNHEFTLIMDWQGEVTDAMADKLYGKCDDCTISSRRGVVFITFDREHESLDAAILSAIHDTCQLGWRALRVDRCDLVNVSEIGRRSGLSKQAISNYTTGKRNAGFPPPVCHIHDDHAPLWSWCEVSTWMVANGLLSSSESQDAFVVDIINLQLAMKQRADQNPELARKIEEQLDCEACQ